MGQSVEQKEAAAAKKAAATKAKTDKAAATKAAADKAAADDAVTSDESDGDAGDPFDRDGVERLEALSMASHKRINDAMVMYNGSQYDPKYLPPGVDASRLPSVTEWFAKRRRTED